MTRIDHPGNTSALIGARSGYCKWAFTLSGRRGGPGKFAPLGTSWPAWGLIFFRRAAPRKNAPPRGAASYTQ